MSWSAIATNINRVLVLLNRGVMGAANEEAEKRKKQITIRLSCYDFRTETDKFGLTRPALYEIVRKLPEPTIHVRNIKPLGFKRIIIGIRSKELWRKLMDATRIEHLLGIPYPRLVAILGFFLGYIVHIAYVVHESLFTRVFKDLEAWVQELERRGVSVEYFFGGESIPVRNCAGALGFDGEVVSSAQNVLESLLKKASYRSRMPFLDYIIVATLDLFPTLTPKQLGHLVYAARARLEKGLDKWTLSFLRFKFINRHYRALSQKGIVGRIWAPRAVLGKCYERLGFIATSDCLEDVYVSASATLSAANIVVSKDYVMASVNIVPEHRGEVLRRLRDCIVKALVTYRARVFPLPFELYDPVRRVWSTKPVGYDLYELLKRFRLMEQKNTN